MAACQEEVAAPARPAVLTYAAVSYVSPSTPCRTGRPYGRAFPSLAPASGDTAAPPSLPAAESALHSPTLTHRRLPPVRR